MHSYTLCFGDALMKSRRSEVRAAAPPAPGMVTPGLPVLCVPPGTAVLRRANEGRL